MADDSPSTGSSPRRRFLQRAGLVGAGAAAAALWRSDSEGAAPAPRPAVADAVAAVNVRAAPYGAKGDGDADDTEAIRRALAAGAGGAVYFPPGEYLVTGPLAPASRTLLFGSHTPRWQDGYDAEDPPSATKLRAGEGFERGAGLIEPASTAVAVTLRNLALVGAGAGEEVHGVRMPASEEATGNSSWAFQDVSIAGFTGDGIRGRLQCALLDHCYVSANDGWGVSAASGDNWSDCHVANCFFFYNRRGNLVFGGETPTGAVDFVNCRFERAGVDPRDVGTPRNPSAPGVRLAGGEFLHFANCSTDANTGNGFEIVRERDEAGTPRHIFLANCRFNRDGTGDGRRSGDFAGLKVRGSGPDRTVDYVKAVNCSVNHGLAEDGAQEGVRGPRHGVWYEHTRFFQWLGGSVSSAATEDRGYEAGLRTAYRAPAGTNEATTIADLETGLHSLPLRRPPAEAEPPDGSVYYEPAGAGGEGGRLWVRDGTGRDGAPRWRSVTVR